MHALMQFLLSSPLTHATHRIIRLRPLFLALTLTLIPQIHGLGQSHPLDSLTANEIDRAAQAITSLGKAGRDPLFPIIALNEPPKAEVLNWKAGMPVRREAFAMVLDRERNSTFEVMVDLHNPTNVNWKQIEGVQSMFTTVDDAAVIKAVRENPDWQAAMTRRGITHFDDVAISTWAPGHFAIAGRSQGDRFFRAIFNLKGSQTNYFGPPIEGVEAVIDATSPKSDIAPQAVHVTDHGIRTIAKESTDFFNPILRGTNRPALKPLLVSQPDGPSFTLQGNEVRWDRWRFRYGFHPREGLVLYQVTYNDEDCERSVLYRASISEMLVPYGDGAPAWFWRNAFDEGEYGLGKSSSPLELGQNTPAHATLVDVPMANDTGTSETWPRRIDIYEREGDTLWTHFDTYAQVTEGRRSRELVMGFIATIGNYDYAFHWIFRQDGSIEFVTELTGIILTKGVDATRCQVCLQNQGRSGTIVPTGVDRPGTLVAPNTVGVNHQHFINMRLDFDVDGASNSVKEINTRALPRSRENPHNNAFIATQTVFGRENEAMRDVNPASHRAWAIFNPSVSSQLGHNSAYVLEPGANAQPFLSRNSEVRRFAGFLDHAFFATRYNASELYAAGPYPTHAPKPENIATYARNKQSILNQDVVAWYTFGITHVTRPEDYPVMPAARAGFKIVPKGFFNHNPALNVPSASKPLR